MGYSSKDNYNRKSVTDDINNLKIDEISMDDMFNTDSLLDLLDEVSTQEDDLKKAVNSKTNSFVVKKAEEKTENAMAEVHLAPQPARQPARKRRKAAQGSDDDIQSAPVEEPMPTESEPTIQYQNIRTVHLSPDVVMHIIEASDMPAAPTVPSVSEIRARGLLLTDNVRQASQTTFKF